MFIIKEDKTRKVSEGQYFVELTSNRGLEISNCDRLGYWCDKGHLEHFMQELNKVFSVQEEVNNSNEENQDIIVFEGREYEFVNNGALSCEGCDLRNTPMCEEVICNPSDRKDGNAGQFKLIERVFDLIEGEFYYATDESSNTNWIFQYLPRGDNDNYIFSLYSYNTKTEGLEGKRIELMDVKRLATNREKQILIDDVEYELGLVYNEKSKEFEEKEEDILVPENIKIVHRKGCSSDFGILFNQDKQVLYFNDVNNVYIVSAFTKYYWDKTPCKLIETNIHNLKSGDIFYIGNKDVNNEMASLNQLHHYAMYINKDNYVTCNGMSTITENNFLYDFTPYKLIPTK